MNFLLNDFVPAPPPPPLGFKLNTESINDYEHSVHVPVNQSNCPVFNINFAELYCINIIPMVTSY